MVIAFLWVFVYYGRVCTNSNFRLYGMELSVRLHSVDVLHVAIPLVESDPVKSFQDYLHVVC